MPPPNFNYGISIHLNFTQGISIHLNFLTCISKIEFSSTLKVKILSNWTKFHWNIWDLSKLYYLCIDTWNTIWTPKRDWDKSNLQDTLPICYRISNAPMNLRWACPFAWTSLYPLWDTLSLIINSKYKTL